MVKEIAKVLCFCSFGENWKIQNGRHFLKFFEILKSLYLAPLRRYRQFCVFALSHLLKIAKIAITHWILTIGLTKR